MASSFGQCVHDKFSQTRQDILATTMQCLEHVTELQIMSLVFSFKCLHQTLELPFTSPGTSKLIYDQLRDLARGKQLRTDAYIISAKTKANNVAFPRRANSCGEYELELKTRVMHDDVAWLAHAYVRFAILLEHGVKMNDQLKSRDISLQCLVFDHCIPAERYRRILSTIDLVCETDQPRFLDEVELAFKYHIRMIADIMTNEWEPLPWAS